MHFRPRLQSFQSLLRLRHLATLSIHDFFNAQQFFLINTPIITSNDCEGAGEIFTIQPDNLELLKTMTKSPINNPEKVFFDKKVFLTVSGQMHLEASAHALSKVYTLGPTFRAENSKSRLHLNEFYMLEAEIAFLKDLGPLLAHVEKMLKLVTERVIDKNLEDLTALLGYDVEKHFEWLNKPFCIMIYDEVKEILMKQDNFKSKFDPNEGLSKEHELFLVDFNGNTPTFVTEWPEHLKPFYMKSSGDKVRLFWYLSFQEIRKLGPDLDYCLMNEIYFGFFF